ncbi:hypothetical protein BOTBODRAFT_172297 [Botryobasidium botryosum FD-172 SS1]|uniref:Uncharacterized protein n=1 Tax=Botryobasidium botryosum (strain FD-172 SS1) TaxID=930990 RepID=A0A067N0C5_BOTB1|nr:hypothetical protein BOTBODRAFT_172297 [Botryobasidium botryosum FD-172 SS1]
MLLCRLHKTRCAPTSHFNLNAPALFGRPVPAPCPLPDGIRWYCEPLNGTSRRDPRGGDIVSLGLGSLWGSNGIHVWLLTSSVSSGILIVVGIFTALSMNCPDGTCLFDHRHFTYMYAAPTDRAKNDLPNHIISTRRRPPKTSSLQRIWELVLRDPGISILNRTLESQMPPPSSAKLSLGVWPTDESFVERM